MLESSVSVISKMDPYKRLFRAVLIQAIYDATCDVSKYKHPRTENCLAKVEALRFLTTKSVQLQLVCDLADVPMCKVLSVDYNKLESIVKDSTYT